MRQPAPVATEQVDLLRVEVYEDRAAMGLAAATVVAGWIREAATSRLARVIFASAPSQRDLLAGLAAAEVPWERVEAFHMDEYIGIAPDDPDSFSAFLVRSLIGQVSPHAFHAIDGNAPPAEEARRYATLLSRAPIDVVCCGIGENGHLAFNEPETADFNDPATVKEVRLEEASRIQQVHDGTFPTLDRVPRSALTLTVPALTSAAHMACVVPGPTKRAAVRRLLRGSVEPKCPASALRLHPGAILYLDRDAYESAAQER